MTNHGGAPDLGTGTFRFDTPKELPDGRIVDKMHFRDGVPDFDDYVVGGKHELWEVTGNATSDARELKRVMRQADPNWTAPSKKDYVLHHFHDGTVGYVPRTIHDRGAGGVAHTGGRSMMDNELF